MDSSDDDDQPLVLTSSPPNHRRTAAAAAPGVRKASTSSTPAAGTNGKAKQEEGDSNNLPLNNRVTSSSKVRAKPKSAPKGTTSSPAAAKNCAASSGPETPTPIRSSRIDSVTAAKTVASAVVSTALSMRRRPEKYPRGCATPGGQSPWACANPGSTRVASSGSPESGACTGGGPDDKCGPAEAAPDLGRAGIASQSVAHLHRSSKRLASDRDPLLPSGHRHRVIECLDMRKDLL